MLCGRLPTRHLRHRLPRRALARSLRYANAGHLPPLLCGPDGVPARRRRPAAGRGRAPRLRESELALEPRRAPLRLHGRADRGAPLGRDVRPRAPGPAGGGAARLPRAPGARARRCTTRSPNGPAGMSDDAVALALRRVRLTRRARSPTPPFPLEWAPCLKGPTRAPAWTNRIRTRWRRWWRCCRGIDTGRPSRAALALGPLRERAAAGRAARASRSPATAWARR